MAPHFETRPTAIDLYCGAGGATLGLKQAGATVLLGVEMDEAAALSYRANHPEVQLENTDILTLSPRRLRRNLNLAPGDLTILKTCPPCQPYSSLGRGGNRDSGDRLIEQTITWVREFRPRIVMLENVRGVRGSVAFDNLTRALNRLGYNVRTSEVNAVDFGIPQLRHRVIMVAWDRSAPQLGPWLFKPVRSSSKKSLSAASLLRSLITKIPKNDPINRSRQSTPEVQRRIMAIPPGGDRFDLPKNLQLECHKRLNQRAAATASYGRIPLKGPAPTMTTRCTTPSCGRFIHPRANRGLTLREAAALQGFPTTYQFEGAYGDIERQIGNAVPPNITRVITRRLLSRLP